MDNYINISNLNDFIFCPYSIYLHNVYMEVSDDLYKAAPQTKGTLAHKGIDKKTYSNSLNDFLALSVISEELGLIGKIDVYKQQEKLLIERKYRLNKIYKGNLYQVWAQYFCMIEMGYSIEKIAFYEISKNKMIYQKLPDKSDKADLCDLIMQIRLYDPSDNIYVNYNKCIHCIYCNLCDKTSYDHVYT